MLHASSWCIVIAWSITVTHHVRVTLVLMLLLYYAQMQLVVAINEELEDIDIKLLEQVYIAYIHIIRICIHT
jgi:hypothetical protein